MKIGIISDTHGHLPQEIYHYFKNCDEIWHAGDIGTTEVAEKLSNFKPSQIVYGNIDNPTLRKLYPHTHTFERQGIRICLTHIAGSPPKYNPHTRKIIQAYNPHMLICGHTHILHIERDKQGLLYINPGAAGNYGIHQIQTIIRFDIINSKPANMEAIEIGKRNIS